jgi:putative tryptophan/tyrosine transport system substrate-binding protein
MLRRDFIAGVGSAAVWPALARAQQSAMPVIGFLHGSGLQANRDGVQAFRKGLGEIGYVEGQNVIVEYRWAEGQYERLRGMATDLVRRRVAGIVTPLSTAATLAAKAATTTIPIVFSAGVDPVQAGLVGSLNRPGGNVTGFVTMGNEIGAKRLELLHELIPAAASFAVLVNPTIPQVAEAVIADLQTAASAIGRPIEVITASTDGEIDTAFADLGQKRIGALLVAADLFFTARRAQIVTLASRRAVPVMYSSRAGGLVSYGVSQTDPYRQAGIYVGRILKGEKPGDLPVARPTEFELVINLKTSKALGLTIPEKLLATADEVIQ